MAGEREKGRKRGSKVSRLRKRGEWNKKVRKGVRTWTRAKW